MKQYRRKVNSVKAVQWTGDNQEEIKEFLGEDLVTIYTTGTLIMCTLTGREHVPKWNFIIRESDNYPIQVKPEFFENNYEEIL